MTLQSPVSGTEWNQGSTSSTDSTDNGGGSRHRDERRRGIRFQTIHNAIDDLGWDPNGNETVSIPTDDYTLVEVPNGTYQIGRNVLYGTTNLGIVGIGDDVTFQAPPGQCVRAIQVSSNDIATNLLLENIEFHQRDGLRAGIELSLNVSDGLEIHNCSRTGMTPNRDTAGGPYNHEPNGLTVSIRNSGGTGTISNWTDHCETEVIAYPKNAQGIFSGWGSKGTLTIKDSSIKNQGEHGIYASKAWNVHIENTELINNVNTGCRIAGEGSYTDNCRIGYNREASYTDHHDDKPGRKATKIFRVENSRKGVAGGEIRNCELFCDTDGLSTNKMLHIMGNTGGMRINDTTIRNNSDAAGVVIDAIGSGWRGYEPPKDWVEFSNVSFVGSSDSPPIDSDRPGAVRTNGCTFDMSTPPQI